MARVRSYRAEDVPAVIEMHRRTLLADREPSAELASYMDGFYGNTLFDHPWLDDGVSSLVYEGEDGRILGFVGVIPRPMLFGSEQLRAAVSVRFMVEPDHSLSALAAAALHRAFLHGPQDLSLVENANDAARRVWQGTRCSTVLGLGSISWGVPAATVAPSVGPSDELDADTLLPLIRSAADRHALRPHYDEKSLGWLLDYLGDAGYRGDLQGRTVHGPDGAGLGWFLYYRRTDGYNGVLQLVWYDDPAPVLDALLAHTAGSGTPTRGRLQPDLLPHVAARGGELAPGPWTVVHSRDPRIIDAFRRDQAFLTRLEGEFC